MSSSIWTFFFKYRNLLAALPLVYAFFSVRWEYEVDSVIWPVAGLLAVVGAALRAWARCHCSYALGRRKTLATTGPYRFIRNPLYVGNLIIIAAAGVASELEWFVPMALLWAFLVYCATIRHEEIRLETKYGDAFRSYRSSVAAWWPQSLTPRVPQAPWLVEGNAFAMAFLAQAAYASLSLLPFLVKELNPFGMWPHP